MLEIYEEANLTDLEIAKMPAYFDGTIDFYGTTAYEKLFEYFAFTICEMPYGTAKARDGDPVDWILSRMEDIEPTACEAR